MNKSKLLLFTSLVIMSFLIAACTGVAPGSWPGLTVAKDTAYLADASFVYGVKLSDGTLAWQYPAKAASNISYYAAPILTPDSSQLIIGDYSNTLTSLDPSNGNVLWTYKDAKNRWIASPLITQDTIYAPNSDNTLYALDFQGKLKWKFATNAALWAQPATDGKVIYLASMDHSLYALQDGTQIWKTDLGAALVSSPVVDSKGTLYIGSLGNEILAVQASGGKILWRTSTTGGIWSQVTQKDNNIFAGDLSGEIYGLAADTGKILWQQKPGGVINGGLTVFQNGLIYGNDAGILTAVDFNGNQLWTKTFNGKLYTSPVFVTDRLYIAITGSSDSTLLVALDTTGNQKWSFVRPK